MDKDKHLTPIMNDIVDSVNGGDGSVLHEDRVMELPTRQKVNRLSAHNRPAHERGAATLEI